MTVSDSVKNFLAEIAPDILTATAGLQILTLEDLTLETESPNLAKPRMILAENLDSLQVVSQVLMGSARAMLQKRELFFEKDLRLALSLLKNPDLYFQNTTLGIDPENRVSLSKAFSSPKQKSDLKQECLEFVAQESRHVRESVDALFEEFYMNAIFDAPREAEKKGLPHNLYESGYSATLTIAKNHERLVISCSDPYGTLSSTKFLQRLVQVLAEGAGEAINMRGPGAGIGCSIIFEHTDFLLIGVVPGKKTLVSAFMPLKSSFRQRSQSQKSLLLVNE